jgi:hypothetical protein
MIFKRGADAPLGHPHNRAGRNVLVWIKKLLTDSSFVRKGINLGEGIALLFDTFVREVEH